MKQVINKKPNISSVIGIKSIINWSNITNRIGKAIDRNINSINRFSPNILRNNLKKAFRAHPATAKQARMVDNLKSELRPLGSPHTGSGLTFRIDKINQTLLFRVILTKRKLGKDGFYTLLVAAKGRKRIPFHSLGSGFQAFGLRIKSGNVINRSSKSLASIGGFSSGKRGRVVVPHKGDIAAVRPYHRWDLISKKKSVKDLRELASKLNRSKRGVVRI